MICIACLFFISDLHAGMCWMRVRRVRRVGGPVRVAGRELAVADVRWDHELLGHHHVHRDEVALQRLNAVFSVVMWVAPVVFEVEKSLRL